MVEELDTSKEVEDTAHSAQDLASKADMAGSGDQSPDLPAYDPPSGGTITEPSDLASPNTAFQVYEVENYDTGTRQMRRRSRTATVGADGSLSFSDWSSWTVLFTATG